MMYHEILQGLMFVMCFACIFALSMKVDSLKKRIVKLEKRRFLFIRPSFEEMMVGCYNCRQTMEPREPLGAPFDEQVDYEDEE